MPVSNKYPAVRPALLLNFARSRQLDPRVTFSRASVGSYYDSSGVLQQALSNRPRFDFNPATGASLGLMIEEQRSNLVTYSEDATNNNFADNVTITANTIVAPDGTTTADTIASTITGGSNTCFVQKNTSVAVNTQTYTFTIFLKAGTSPTVTLNMQLYGGTYQQSVTTVTWATNTITTTVGGTSSITAGANGWYRVSLTLTNNGTNNLAAPRVYVKDQGTSNVSGQTVHVWGWQLEAGSFPTSYIQTVASQNTRAADLAVMTGTNFSSWFNASAGTFIATANIQSDRITASTFRSSLQAIATSTYNSDSLFVFRNSGGQGASEVRSGSATVASLATGILSTRITTALAYALNDFAGSSTGATVSTDTTGALPVGLDRLVIGNVGDNNTLGTLNGTIERIAFYSSRLTNSQLESLSL